MAFITQKWCHHTRDVSRDALEFRQNSMVNLPSDHRVFAPNPECLPRHDDVISRRHHLIGDGTSTFFFFFFGSCAGMSVGDRIFPCQQASQWQARAHKSRASPAPNWESATLLPLEKMTALDRGVNGIVPWWCHSPPEASPSPGSTPKSPRDLGTLFTIQFYSPQNSISTSFPFHIPS